VTFPHLGKTVVVWSLPSIVDLPHYEERSLSGIIQIEDYVTTERGAYVIVFDECGQSYSVDPDQLCEQIDPKWYGQMLISEREMEFASEMMD